MSGVSEKRKYRRLPVKGLPCRVFLEGQVIDLSIGGAFVATERPFPSGVQVSLEATLPGEGTIRASTLVEWSGDYFQGTVGKPCIGMGLSFQEIDAEDRNAITRFLVHVHQVTQASKRVVTDLDARVRVGGAWMPGHVRAINERGLFFETTSAVPLGDEIDILVRFPSASRPIDFTGVVVQVAGGGAPAGGAVFAPSAEAAVRGLEIEITELSPVAREVLQEFLEEERADRRDSSEE